MEENIRNKGGRPPKSIKLSKNLKVSFSEEDAAAVKNKAKLLSLTVSGYIRMVSLKGEVLAVFSEESKLEKRAITGVANNLNQLVKEAHTYGLLSIENEAKIILSEVREILNTYKLKNQKL